MDMVSKGYASRGCLRRLSSGAMSAEPVAAAAANAARGTSRLQSRIEPTFGRLS